MEQQYRIKKTKKNKAKNMLKRPPQLFNYIEYEKILKINKLIEGFYKHLLKNTIKRNS